MRHIEKKIRQLLILELKKANKQKEAPKDNKQIVLIARKAIINHYKQNKLSNVTPLFS